MELKEYNPIVSIIVPVYKVEKYLRRCVDSLIGQTLKEIEIILVDDGSPDNCGKIIDEYAEKYNTVVAVHKENGGLSDARNKGIEYARGQYIGFADSDDYCEPKMYEKLYNSAQNNNSDLVLCGYTEVFSENCSEIRKSEHILGDDNKNSLISEFVNGYIGAYAWNKLYKKCIIEKNKILFEKGVLLVEDNLFFCEYAKYVEKFSVVNEPLYNYIRNSESICAKYYKNHIEYYIMSYKAKKDLINCLPKNPAEELLGINDVNLIEMSFATLDKLSSKANKDKISVRYKDFCNIIKNEDFRGLIEKNKQYITDKKTLKNCDLVLKNKYKTFFFRDYIKMRVIKRVKYYLG